MSFNNDVKTEIADARVKADCCRAAQCYAMLLYSGSRGGISSSCEATAKLFRSLMKKCCSVVCSESSSGRLFRAVVPDSDLPEVLSHFKISSEVNEQLLCCERCTTAFIKGAFLACGVISDPDSEYHLEFVSKIESALYYLCRLLREQGFDAKLCERGSRYVVYVKNSENIEDLLTLMGAGHSSLKIMNAKILREIRNNTNRTTNFQTANIKKSSVSCAKQLEAIKKLERQGRLIALPDELYELATVRRDNIDMSLTELGRLVGLSRAGVHHRLKKIIDFAEARDNS